MEPSVLLMVDVDHVIMAAVNVGAKLDVFTLRPTLYRALMVAKKLPSAPQFLGVGGPRAVSCPCVLQFANAACANTHVAKRSTPPPPPPSSAFQSDIVVHGSSFALPPCKQLLAWLLTFH